VLILQIDPYSAPAILKMNTVSSDVLFYNLIPYLTDTELFCGLVGVSKQCETYKKYRKVITKPVHIWETLKLKHLTFTSVIVDQKYQNSYKYIQKEVTQLSIEMNRQHSCRAIPEIPEHIKHLRILNHLGMITYIDKPFRHIKTLEFVKENFLNCGDWLPDMVLDALIVHQVTNEDCLFTSLMGSQMKTLIVRDSIHLTCLNHSMLRGVIVYANNIECGAYALRSKRTYGGYWCVWMKELHLKHWDEEILPIERISPYVQFYVDGTLYNKDNYLDPNIK